MVTRITSDFLQDLLELYRFLIPDQKIAPAVAQRIFSRLQQSPEYHLLGYFEDNRLLGSAMGIVCLDLAFDGSPFFIVENVIVHPDSQGKGIGKALMEALEKIAIEQGCVFIEFCSSMARTDAHAFYERIGYSPQAVRGFRKYLKS